MPSVVAHAVLAIAGANPNSCAVRPGVVTRPANSPHQPGAAGITAPLGPPANSLAPDHVTARGVIGVALTIAGLVLRGPATIAYRAAIESLAAGASPPFPACFAVNAEDNRTRAGFGGAGAGATAAGAGVATVRAET